MGSLIGCRAAGVLNPQHPEQGGTLAPVQGSHRKNTPTSVPRCASKGHLPCCTWTVHSVWLSRSPDLLPTHTLCLPFRNAVEEGKGIFYNIKNFVRFQLST